MTTPTAAPDLDRTRATGAELRAALQTSARWLSANAERINALNVFPVPDGDTGTNMSMTLQEAVDRLRLDDDAPVADVARSVAKEALETARGNSGVILSQLLSGFSAALADATELTPVSLAHAFTSASDAAYHAVSQPIEGTILTVARAVASAATAAAQSGSDLPDCLRQTLRAATAAVSATPSQLEALRKAGVVDAGGEGYRVIIEGAWMWSTGRTLQLDQARGAGSRDDGRARLQATSGEESTFGFCTEFLLRGADLPLGEVRTRMQALGESVLAVGNGDLMRVHVHTLRPGQALEFAVDHGTLAKVKVENMQLQHAAFAAGVTTPGAPEDQAASTIGVIAVAAGEGLVNVFTSLNALVVHGGQTMNPSVQEILAAVNTSGRQELIILPNNTNLILTARQVAELTPHRVAVVPTETTPQGVAALLAFNFEADLQTNVEAMQRAAGDVHTVEVTRSVRDAEVDGVQVKSGDMLGIYDGHVVEASGSAEDALVRTLDRASVPACEIVTIYYGAGTSDKDAHAAARRIQDAHPGLAVEVVMGGQPHYPYVVSLE
ncbi:MAG: DAK2 domain-containing protein [Chloroflexota bacterium]